MSLSATAIIQSVATLTAFPGMSALTTAQAEALIHSASASIRKYTSRRLLIDAQADATVYVNGGGEKDLFVPEGPISAITTLKVDTDRVFGSGTEYDLDDIVIAGGNRGSSHTDDGEDFPTTIHSLATSCFDIGFKNVQVIGRFGYNDAAGRYSIPEDLVQACAMLCKHYHLHSDPSMTSQRTQTYSYQLGGPADYIGGMPKAIAATLDPYKVMRVH